MITDYVQPKQTHYVYRVYAGFEPLYFGCTMHPHQRMLDHARTKPWWPSVTRIEVIGPLPKSDALLLENKLHEDDPPRYSLSGHQVGLIAGATRRRACAAKRDAKAAAPSP